MFVKNCLMASMCLLLAFFTADLSGQSNSATVTGFVTDETGATIPHASVAVINVRSGVASTATTNASGLYRIPGLIPGTYRANVTADGFKSLVKEGIDLHLEDEVSVNYSLAVGSVNETVIVQAGAEIIETSSPTTSQVIEGRQVQDTPLNGRNVMNLVALTPGVVPQGGSAGAATQNQDGGLITNSYGWNNYQIGGGLAGQSAEYLDGAPLNVIIGNSNTLIPTQDAIQEFRVESSVVNVRYGAFGGGVVSFATKSGANDFHGTAYEFLRNTVFDANTFFDNLYGQPRPTLHQNQFGAAAGRRIIRDKLFAFFSYEGFRLTQSIPNSGRIPTPAELSGVFTQDAPIYDPTTGHQFICNGVLNVICPNRIDPTANVMANVVHYWPTPNTSSPTVNFSRNATSGSSNDQYTGRVDWDLGKHKLFSRYTYWNSSQQATQYFTGTNGPEFTPASANVTHQAVLGDTYVLNNSTILDLRASYLRFHQGLIPNPTSVNLSEFGPFYAAIQTQVTYPEYPIVYLPGTLSLPYGGLDINTETRTNTYALSGTLTKVLAKHSLSFGGEARRQEEYGSETNYPTGFQVFAGAFTGCAASCTTPTGTPSTATPAGSGATPIADFLIGRITASDGFVEVTTPSAYNFYGGLFAEDIFKYSSKLTLTYGVRYELPGSFLEKHDRNTVLLPQLTNPLVLVNSSAYASRSDLGPHHTLFSPRIGFAFAATPETVVRAGYSLAFLPQYVSNEAGPYTSPVNMATTYVSFGSLLSAPLGASTTLQQPIGRAYTGTQYNGTSVGGRIPNQSFPDLQQYNLNVQQTFSPSTAFQLGYLGTRGEHMVVAEAGMDINQLPEKYVGLPAAQLSQSLRPYPQYQAVNAYSSFVGDTYYNSLQASLTKRFGSGGTFLANYTWSKFRGNAEALTAFLEASNIGLIQDYDNLRGEKSLLTFDTPQRFVVSYVLDLPFGRGKPFLGDAHGIENELVGGWNVSGISTFNSGFPLALIGTSNTLESSYGAGTIRPNYLAGCSKAVDGSIVSRAQNTQTIINKQCFSQPAATSFGNEPRVDPSLRAQGVDNWDASIGKTTPIHENVNLVFRAEAFNLFNRVQFAAPNTTATSALFGVITSQANMPRVLQFSLRANF